MSETNESSGDLHSDAMKFFNTLPQDQLVRAFTSATMIGGVILQSAGEVTKGNVFAAQHSLPGVGVRLGDDNEEIGTHPMTVNIFVCSDEVAKVLNEALNQVAEHKNNQWEHKKQQTQEPVPKHPRDN